MPPARTATKRRTTAERLPFYLLPMYDMWGEVFDAPGTRTTGNVAGAFAVVPPGWSGTLPEGVRRIDAPHAMVWIIGRTKASPQTYAQVHRFQDGLRITPLSAWGSDAPPVKGVHDPSIDDTTPPLRTVDEMSPDDFLATAAELLRRYPPHFNDLPLLHRLERAGLRVGESFDLDAAEPAVRSALATALPEARAHVAGFQKRIGRTVNGWLMNTAGMGTYGTDYLKRACVELIGLGANCAEDAIYPLSYTDADGEPYAGEHAYVLHFGKDEVPPALAFWSMTLYDDEGFQVANALDRFAIGDRDALAYGDDGSLALYIGHASPGEERETNWLPAPEGSFNLCLRLYQPAPDALDGTWSPPAVAKQPTI